MKPARALAAATSTWLAVCSARAQQPPPLPAPPPQADVPPQLPPTTPQQPRPSDGRRAGAYPNYPVYPYPPYAYPYPYAPYAYPGPPPAGPSAPHEDSSARRHDGFYFQLASGLTHERVSFDGKGSRSGAATGGAVDLAFGGTVSRGLVIAGAVSFRSATVELEAGGAAATPAAVRSSLIGLMLAYYPDPKRGLHFQAGAGFATAHVSDGDDDYAPGASARDAVGASDFDGFGVLAAVGHEWYISDDWSVGLAARVDAAWVQGQGTVDATARQLAPSARFTLTFH